MESSRIPTIKKILMDVNHFMTIETIVDFKNTINKSIELNSIIKKTGDKNKTEELEKLLDELKEYADSDNHVLIESMDDLKTITQLASELSKIKAD